MVDDDYEKKLRKLRFKKVSEAFKSEGKERVKHFEELGFCVKTNFSYVT
jgi:hypothetical protein